MGISDKIRQQLIETFKAEQAEHVQKINQGLLALEKDPEGSQRQALLEEIFRAAHSLKGSARAIGMSTTESIGHLMEDILLQVKEGQRQLTPEHYDLLYQALDAIELVMQHAEQGSTTAPAKVLGLLSTLEEVAQTDPSAPAEEAPQQAEEETPAESTKEQVALETEETAAEDASTEMLSPAPPKEGGSAPSPLAGTSSDETIRVSVSKLDTLMAQFSELLGTKIRIEQRLAEVRELQNFASQWQKEWLGLRGHYNRLMRNNEQQDHQDVSVLLSYTTDSHDNLRNLNTQTNLLYRRLSNDAMRLSLVIDELQEEIKRVRMLPLATITTTFERLVRDVARKQGKKVNLVIEGNETELDKRVLEQIKDPLIHLLRNAVDHGIETPEERKAEEKPPVGEIRLSAHQQGNNVVISVKDNGKGLDLPAIRASAIKNGLITQSEYAKMTPDDAAMLIFSAGLSTSRMITDISGRGVGMDVVRQNVTELHGTLKVTFEPKQSTTITITLPLTLASSRGLLVRAGDQLFALPFSTIERMLEIDQEQIGSVEGREVVTYRDRAVALIWLEDLLELPMSVRDLSRLTVVIINVAEKRLGLVVNALEGEQEIVMKSLGMQLAKVGGIAGATVLGSGQVVLVLNAADLISLASQAHRRMANTVVEQSSQSQTSNQKLILVADDSITTRTLEKNILEAAGYRVNVATNGEEAFSSLTVGDMPDLVVSDVNMPQLNGFELTQRLKQDTRYANIPVILVTSLDSPADKAKGMQAGADAYIVKTHFDQGNLLDTIEQLV